jgi:hypothetical protein
VGLSILRVRVPCSRSPLKSKGRAWLPPSSITGPCRPHGSGLGNGDRITECCEKIYFVGVGSLTQNLRSPGSILVPALRDERGAAATRGRITLAAGLVTLPFSFTSGMSRGGGVDVSSTGKRSLTPHAPYVRRLRCSNLGGRSGTTP